jgi:hypothetical protein
LLLSQFSYKRFDADVTANSNDPHRLLIETTAGGFFNLVPAVESAAPITMAVDPKWRDETMKVIIAKDRVIRMSKRILQSEFSGTYIGITSFAADVQMEFFAKVSNLIRTGNDNEFFNVAVQPNPSGCGSERKTDSFS